MDKISDYIGKQRKNSDGECDIHIPYSIMHLFQRLLGFSKQFLFLLVCGPVEADPEYRLIVAANNLTVEIDNELSEFYRPLLKHFCHQC